MAALAVSTATELKRWQPLRDFAWQNNRLVLTSEGRAQCGGSCPNTQALLDMQDDAASGVSSAGADDVAAGQEKSMTCQACHGPVGIAASEQWPNLAGQHATYLLHAMLQYRNGERDNSIMAPLVAALDEDTLAEIAAFYAAQEGLYQTDR